jgi:hypothetical protein
VTISETDVVFVGAGGEEGPLWRYNVIIGEKTKLPVRNCVPVSWHGPSGQLVCSSVKETTLVDLKTGAATLVPLPRGAFTLFYIAEYDVFLITRPMIVAGDERWDVWPDLNTSFCQVPDITRLLA